MYGCLSKEKLRREESQSKQDIIQGKYNLRNMNSMIGNSSMTNYLLGRTNENSYSSCMQLAGKKLTDEEKEKVREICQGNFTIFKEVVQDIKKTDKDYDESDLDTLNFTDKDKKDLFKGLENKMSAISKAEEFDKFMATIPDRVILSPKFQQRHLAQDGERAKEVAEERFTKKETNDSTSIDSALRNDFENDILDNSTKEATTVITKDQYRTWSYHKVLADEDEVNSLDINDINEIYTDNSYENFYIKTKVDYEDRKIEVGKAAWRVKHLERYL